MMMMLMMLVTMMKMIMMMMMMMMVMVMMMMMVMWKLKLKFYKVEMVRLKLISIVCLLTQLIFAGAFGHRNKTIIPSQTALAGPWRATVEDNACTVRIAS